MNLREIQRSFSKAVYQQSPLNSEPRKESVLSYLKTGENLEIAHGLKVYQGNLVFTVLEQLTLLYPALNRILGTRNFRYFVREMLYSQASVCSDVAKYGYDFHLFLSRRRELDQQQYLSELAKLEAEIARVSQVSGFNERPSRSKEQITATSQMPVLSSHVRVLTSQYQLDDLYAWSMEQIQSETELTITSDICTVMQEKALFVVHRDQNTVQVARLPIELHEIFLECQGEKSLNQVAARLDLSLSELVETIHYFSHLEWVRD